MYRLNPFGVHDYCGLSIIPCILTPCKSLQVSEYCCYSILFHSICCKTVSSLPSSIQAPPGLAVALPVVRAPPAGLRDQGDRVVRVPRQMGLQGRGRSSNNKPRHQRPGRGSLVPRVPLPALSSSPQPRDKAWAWA